jgi:hypothetical protein
MLRLWRKIGKHTRPARWIVPKALSQAADEAVPLPVKRIPQPPRTMPGLFALDCESERYWLFVRERDKLPIMVTGSWALLLANA